jgi:hypothetical protein
VILFRIFFFQFSFSTFVVFFFFLLFVDGSELKKKKSNGGDDDKQVGNVRHAVKKVRCDTSQTVIGELASREDVDDIRRLEMNKNN